MATVPQHQPCKFRGSFQLFKLSASNYRRFLMMNYRETLGLLLD